MTVSPVSPTLTLNQAIFDSRELLQDLQEQLATGRKVKTYGDLGVARNQILSMRAELSQIKSYKSTISQIDVRTDVMLSSLERLREMVSTTKSDALEVGFALQGNGQTVFQTEVVARFDEVVALLNTNIGDRHLFSGRDIETAPVRPSVEIMEGAGVRAGFRQIVSERRQADLGADGLGRLALTGPHASVLGAVVATPGDIGGAAPAQFTIDIGGNAQTFDISDAGSDTLAALESAIDTAFGADVASIVGGNQLRLTAQNPTESITITDVDAGAAALAGLTQGVTTNPTASVNVTEDVAGSPFGFKLAGVTTTSAGVTVTPGGPPVNYSVVFNGGTVNDGEHVRVSFNLPDGTQHDITMVARASAPLDEDEFLINADPNVMAANFETALNASIKAEAQQSLSAASLFAAATDFFDFDAANPPQRVDGPPFDTATALRNATQTDTVFWYQGEDKATAARSSIVGKVDDNIVVGYGARANEDAMVSVMKTFAAVAVETFNPADADAPERYHELQIRANSGLNFAGSQSVDDILVEIGVAKTTAGRAEKRHEATEILLEDFIVAEEEADIYEVSSAILTLQTRLEASLQVSASLGNLSLVNFL
ncbi:MAG: hypothetical protein Kow0032_24800 [Methyloligellaceae bacterium]